MFIKLLKYDIKVGVFYQYKKLLIVATVFIAVFMDCYIRLRAYTPAYAPFQVEKTLGNVLLYVFGSSQASEAQFAFPSIWILIYSLLAYFTLYYPYMNLEENGQNILIRSGGRCLWWISKCCWMILTVFLYFAIAWTVLIAACMATNISLSTEISPGIWKFLGMRENLPYLYPTHLTFEIFVMPFLVMIGLSFFK